MKVVVAHNRYVSSVPSGENMVVDAEIEMLREAGVEVIPFLKSSDSLDSVSAKLKASTGPVWAPATRELARIMDEHKPDVLHLHNVYPLISPWAIRTAQTRGVAVVQTVHNYRHVCLNGLLFRDGHTCTQCVGRRLPAPGVRHACYRGSTAQSALMAAGAGLTRRMRASADRYLVLNPHQQETLARAGFPRDRMIVHPTGSPDCYQPGTRRAKQVLYVGRLDRYKGVRLLLDAWETSRASAVGWQLVIAGDGEESQAVRGAAARTSSIDWHGARSSAELRTLYSQASWLAVPSLIREGFPRVISEALSAGCGVLTTPTLAAAAILPPSTSHRIPAEHAAWRSCFDNLAELPDMSPSCREFWKSHLSPGAATKRLLRAYEAASARV